MLGVIIGVAAVIAATGFAMGSTAEVTESIEALGTNKLMVFNDARKSSRDMSYEDFREFTESMPDLISQMAPVVNGGAIIKYGTASDEFGVMGTSPDFADIDDMHVQSGRYILDIDLEYRQKVAVLGTYTAGELFGDISPVGEKIKLNGYIFTVVGILEELDGGQESSRDDTVIIPVTTAQRIFRNARITSFQILATSSEVVEEAQAAIEGYLTDVLGNDELFKVYNAAFFLETLEDITGTMALILGGIAIISLIVGGIGIMNIMLVSVTERTREIGIRKAIGARKSSIMTQFIIEALVLTGLGGIIGIILGISGIVFIISRFVTPVVDPMWVALAFGFSLLIGLVFGIFPAYKAANLNPIEALRYE
jgi:putative ABC transport system permease protein